ncbi:histidinol dehydrogenase [Methanococcoides methylutens]|uniref:Histidinol dehydrogenase n=1 Tax=Methanococcoides methylutens MM1 TaxID=1434104 RepID=A0A0E3X0M6_METMT|nr:histidinol dehydrogenase [Methanococcoides methylutens]AKB85635.1 Histidinol dehydrogenase [Methanococcoides methylutens MM1]
MLYKHLSDVTEEELDKLLDRTGELMDVSETVSAILHDVQEKGDDGLREYTKKFDKADIQAIEVTPEEMEEAMGLVDAELIRHLEIAAENIRNFHAAQLPEKTWFIEPTPGIKLGQMATPLASVGAYVPGGRASYPSTALMTIIPAKVAGVKSVVMCTPPGPDGKVNPLTLAAGKVAGADHIYKLGGVQAIAAMAYGTESVLKVAKIVGPGNVFVTVAKMMVRDKAEIDFPAGPSEVLIIADDSADAGMIASDILAQAEHDPKSVSVLVTTSAELAEQTNAEVKKQADAAVRKEIVDSSLENAAIIVTDTMDECIAISNDFAPEHLEIMVKDDDSVLEMIENAGSIFVGNYAPVAAGDYASGTNHVLPTAGYPKLYSGLNIHHFLKYSTIQKITKEGLGSIGETIIALAEKEGLQAHADSVKLRLND